MPVNANLNQQNEVKRNQENSFRKTTRKVPGTRMGTLQDWRGASNTSGKTAGHHGQSIRDGR